jgi:cellulose synthase/poly-beta-1,6-N-acetylglucosamine synthase-like glycosyltransferase
MEKAWWSVKVSDSPTGEAAAREIEAIAGSKPTRPVEPALNSRRDTTSLDVVSDLRHYGYKVPGMSTWLVFVVLVIGAVLIPNAALVVLQLIGLYLMFRIATVVIFYPVSQIRSRRWEDRARLAAQNGTALVGAAGSVHHVVIIPNYKEPIAILVRTLRALAVQENARQQLSVVLAMEESDKDAAARAHRLQDQFGDQFAHFLITYHPTGLPNEVAGKGSNENWAARRAKEELVDRLGLPIENMTLTSCDADSVFNPYYFATLARLFVADPNRHRRFWQSPMRFDNNTWQLTAPLRLLAFFMNATLGSELADPLTIDLPISTYSLSFKLADEAGYWDSAVIAEDWHMFLRCLFATGGKVSLRPIFLPTSADSAIGDTPRQSMMNTYRQRLRHAWGAQDIGYILQQWRRSPQTPFVIKLLYLSKVVHDHVILTTSGLVVGTVSLLLLALHGASNIAQPGPLRALVAVATVGNIAVGLGMVAVALSEHLLCRRRSPGWRPASLLGDMIMWPFLPFITIGLAGMPVLHAQAKLLFASPLIYVATPKRVDTQRK